MRPASCSADGDEPLRWDTPHSFPLTKSIKAGEYAFLVSSHNGGVIAVADGVSGWTEQTVDPSLFSKEFMANALSYVADDEVNFDPRMLLKKAHAATTSLGSATVSNVQLMEKDIIVMGSSTMFLIRKSLQQWSNAVLLQRMALTELARTHSMDLAFDSPYSMEARSRGFDVPLWKKIVGIRLTGGKLDDITVVVGRVVKTQNLLQGMTDLD